jgi:hypothetical protein
VIDARFVDGLHRIDEELHPNARVAEVDGTDFINQTHENTARIGAWVRRLATDIADQLDFRMRGIIASLRNSGVPADSLMQLNTSS